MREIKFRAWHKQEKKMFRVRSLEWDLLGQKLNRVDGWYHGLMVLMQYTGLKDNDGVEIYECDILQDPINKNERNEVLRVGGGFLLANNNFDYFRDFANTMKVVGNIYENPELLEDTP